jgi:hypothetical protein
MVLFEADGVSEQSHGRTRSESFGGNRGESFSSNAEIRDSAATQCSARTRSDERATRAKQSDGVKRQTGARRLRSDALARSEGEPRSPWSAGRRRTDARSGNAARGGSAEQLGVGLFDSVRWRGALWTTPREETRLCGRVARTETRRESRRQGQEGRARRHESNDERTGRGSSRARARRRARRSRRAAVNGQGAATSIGVLPPAGGTCRMWSVARTMPQRESAASTEADRCLGSWSRSPAERGGGRPTGVSREVSPRRSPAPEGQTNHIPERRAAVVAPKGDALRGG